ncbi:hypothetical protein G5T42_09500 [Microbacterium sp. 4R-513]|uniref:hypothetical protein n=1 Tax=Microbacterium sp. 4R-513 TaxID=2567934 RepID=UPI0013E0F1B3|nr:hypothetical protein [Microbacterium sp. 4R-513]QIG39690.1 hypothetical protein G5T42_09500 [Microbacterium sp. 4R-513]
MHAVDLIIGEHVHRLPMDTDESALLIELTDAVHAGGGVVVLPTPRTQSTVAVLISPGVPVFIERTLIPDEAPDDVSSTTCGDVLEWSDL